MSLLDRFRKGGGGFLNGVDGLITSIAFTTNPDFGGEAREERPAKEGAITKLWFALTVRQDGGKDETTHLDAGGADEFVISDDGTTITPITEASQLWGATDFLKFYASAVEGGLTEPSDPAPGEPISFAHLMGVRARFVQVKNEDAQKRFADAYKKNKGNTRKYYNDQGEKKGKDGKYYAIRSLQIERVISEGNPVEAAESTPTPAAKSSAKPAAKTAKAASAPKAATKANGKATDVEIVDLAKGTLVNILAASKDSTIPKTALNLAVTKALVGKNEVRDAVRIWLYDDANLAALVAEGLITYDKSGKDQKIALA